VEKNDQGKRSKFGRRFDEEFKRDAVRMLESGVRTMGELSQELGVSVWSLGRWSKYRVELFFELGSELSVQRWQLVN
jgi:transposase-like protein